MSDVIKLVAGDNLPNIGVQLVRAVDGKPVDLSPVGTSITVKMRQYGQTTVLVQLPGSVITDGKDGKLQFGFPGSALAVAPGLYEFEIAVSFGAALETVFETLKAQIRARF
jgi:hypothetical protein